MSEIIVGDSLEVLRGMDAESVHCVVTSPPYWGLRDYGVDGQIGLEPTLAEFLARLVAVFEEVRRVLRPDGVAWVNMGDSYAGSWGAQSRPSTAGLSANQVAAHPKMTGTGSLSRLPAGIKGKDLIGQPWRLAFALQDAGWYLRQDVIWAKPNPMPESVRDRCTKAHEYLFLLSKSGRYWWDAEAMKEPVNGGAHARLPGNHSHRGTQALVSGWASGPGAHDALTHATPKAQAATKFDVRVKSNASMDAALRGMVDTRNRRSVWTIPSEPSSESHFASFPRALVRPCVLASCPPDGLVLDPFAGTATTGVVALELGRRFVGIELNPEYAQIARRRLASVPMALDFEGAR